MRRIAEKLALAAAAPLFALASWASCGGSTTINDQDGGAGASPWADCAGPGECVALTPGCCGVCGAPTLSDVVGVNEDELAAFHAATCTDPNPMCPECATAVEPNLVAFCKASRCAPIDIRNDAVSACTTDDDCMLRDPDCCEACAVAPFDLVAIAKDKADAYRSEVCRPAESCPACAPIYPTGYAAICGAAKHCAVVFHDKLCPADLPAMGAPCDNEGLACEYGLDPRPGCRSHASCTNAAWQIAVSGCPPIPGPGVGGCPPAAPPGGLCPTDGLVCDMGADVICVCAQCAGGPCSMDPHWACGAPPTTAGCPAVAPELGSACESEGVVCTYGVCASVTSAGRRCEDGAWQDEPVACPV